MEESILLPVECLVFPRLEVGIVGEFVFYWSRQSPGLNLKKTVS
jgi:hypothetical protein